MSVTIDGKGTLTKDQTTVEPSCGYVELGPGRHAVRLRIEAKDKAQGIHPRLLVYEYGKGQNDWYATFAFACGGGNGPCIKEDMKQWFDRPAPSSAASSTSAARRGSRASAGRSSTRPSRRSRT